MDIGQKKLCASEEGTLFFEQLMKDTELKAANFILKQHCAESKSHSQIQDMLFIKPSGYRNKRTKSFFKIVQKRNKSTFESNLSLTVIDSVPCKTKGRPKKIKENENKALENDKN